MLKYMGMQFIISASDGGIRLVEQPSWEAASLDLDLMFETDLWILMVTEMAGSPVGRKFHDLADRNTLMARQVELRRALPGQCSGQGEAVADQWRACLIQTTAIAYRGQPAVPLLHHEDEGHQTPVQEQDVGGGAVAVWGRGRLY